MECKKVQDKLLTDYLDKELGAGENSEIEAHLSGCIDCREFLAAVQKTSVAPFKESRTLDPDGAVWERVLERIEAEKERSRGGFWKLVDSLASRFPLPLPAMRVAFATALILAVVVLARWPSSYADPAYGYVAEQMTFMGELGAGDTDLMNGELKDYEAVFEEISPSGPALKA